MCDNNIKMNENIKKEIEEFEELMIKLKKAREEIDNDPEFWDLIIGKPKNNV